MTSLYNGKANVVNYYNFAVDPNGKYLAYILAFNHMEGRLYADKVRKDLIYELQDFFKYRKFELRGE